MNKEIFVFGGNTDGYHGAGAALYAHENYGAIIGQSSGLQGNSYAIVTKDLKKGDRSVPLDYIEKQAKEFVQFAKNNKDLTFQLTAVGCGLAGFYHWEIAPFFEDCLYLENVIWPEEWKL